MLALNGVYLRYYIIMHGIKRCVYIGVAVVIALYDTAYDLVHSLKLAAEIRVGRIDCLELLLIELLVNALCNICQRAGVFVYEPLVIHARYI